MKRHILIIIALMSTFGAIAQTNINPPTALGTNSTSSAGLVIKGTLSLLERVYDAMPTNIAVAPYGTYVIQAKKFGYGVGAAYNLSLGPVSGGPIILIDHVDQLFGFSGGVTLKGDIHPLTFIGVTNFVVTPFGITAIGTSLAGGPNGDIQTISSVGADFKFGNLWGGKFLIGGAYGTRTGAGAYSGGYINGFIGWKKDGISIGVKLN